MAIGKRKTRDFKDRECRHCKHADKRALKKGYNCCPFPNPQIRKGLCMLREE